MNSDQVNASGTVNNGPEYLGQQISEALKLEAGGAHEPMIYNEVHRLLRSHLEPAHYATVNNMDVDLKRWYGYFFAESGESALTFVRSLNESARQLHELELSPVDLAHTYRRYCCYIDWVLKPKSVIYAGFLEHGYRNGDGSHVIFRQPLNLTGIKFATLKDFVSSEEPMMWIREWPQPDKENTPFEIWVVPKKLSWRDSGTMAGVFGTCVGEVRPPFTSFTVTEQRRLQLPDLKKSDYSLGYWPGRGEFPICVKSSKVPKVQGYGGRIQISLCADYGRGSYRAHRNAVISVNENWQLRMDVIE